MEEGLERRNRRCDVTLNTLYTEFSMPNKKVNLSVGRGEKLSVSRGAGLTAKGRAKYNKATGSNLKAPQKKGARQDSFCARSESWTGERGKAARKRWGC